MKKFMTAFAAIAASFAAHHAEASVNQNPVQAPSNEFATSNASVAANDKISVSDESGNAFNFVLKRSNETGLMMAWHESHASHASHASHRSHYSSRY